MYEQGVEFWRSEGNWYKGNLHTHTINSDGDLPLNEMVTKYKEKRYDFLAITDHDKLTPIGNILAKDKAVNRLTRWINKYGKIVIPIAALSPLPYLPVVIGSMNFSRRNFIIYGLIPRSIGFVIYGFLVYFLQTL